MFALKSSALLLRPTQVQAMKAATTQLKRSQHSHSDIGSHCGETTLFTGDNHWDNRKMVGYFSAKALNQQENNSEIYYAHQPLPISYDDMDESPCELTKAVPHACPFSCALIPIKSDMSLDVKETPDRYEIKILSPDLTAGNIKLSLRNNFLFLSIQDTPQVSGLKRSGNNVFQLPNNVRLQDIRASTGPIGIIKLTIPKENPHTQRRSSADDWYPMN